MPSRKLMPIWRLVCAGPSWLLLLVMIGMAQGWAAEPLMSTISAGSSHTLAVEKTTGKVYGWGSNEFGQVGDGKTVQRTSPVADVGIGGLVVQAAAGDAHSLALLDDGTVVAWGFNGSGQLGNNSTTLSLAPVSPVLQSTTTPPPALSGIMAIAAGLNHSLALSNDGNVLSWGQNASGQLGINTTIDAKVATPVTTLAGQSIMAITAGPNHSLALRSDGKVYAWGANESGQLGDGKTVILKIPTQITALSNVVAVAAGAKHSLALRNDGTVWAWGANSAGQLGDKTTTARLVPVQVAGVLSGMLTGVVAIAANGEHSLALLSDGTVVAWGSNASGQLGYATGTSIFSKQPTLVGTPAGVVAIAAGTAHSAAVLGSGVTQTWGGNWQGQLGDATRVGRYSPLPIAAVDPAPASTATLVPGVAAGSSHTLKVEASGAVFGWGSNEFGQVGDGTTVQRKQPVATILTTGVRLVAAGDVHSLALLTNGTVQAWGFNGSGQLGDTTTTLSKIPVETKTSSVSTDVPPVTSIVSLGGVTAIAVGLHHSLALRNDGNVLSWGRNASGQLGINSTVDAKQATVIATLAGRSIIAITSGHNHSLALRHDGAVYAWGINESGQLGDGKTVSLKIPTQITALSNVVAVAAGAKHSLALRNDGTVWAWGANSAGQLGDKTTTARLVPVQVAITCSVVGETVTAIAANGEHSLALCRNGEIWAWGNNAVGQLGDTTTINRPTPQRVGLLSGAVAIAAGTAHSAAIWNDGSAQTWGGNWQGQVGDGTQVAKSSPVPIPAGGTTPLSATPLPAITAGSSHTLAVTSLGAVLGWGSNEFGQLGDDTTFRRLKPVATKLTAGVSLVAAGDAHSLALLTNGTVKAWGFNGSGQLGDNTTTLSKIPVDTTTTSVSTDVPPVTSTVPLDGVTAIAVGLHHSLALKSDGSVLSWGRNAAGQLGINSTVDAKQATAITTLAGASITAITAGHNHSLALRHDGVVYAWGGNESGQLGDGKTVNLKVPTQILALTNIIALAAGAKHSLALRNDGTVWAWGANNAGQLGDKTTTARLVAVQVAITCAVGKTVTAIAANGEHSLALCSDGSIWAWGNNAVGQLGDTTNINRPTPQWVGTLTGAVAIAAGSAHSAAIWNDDSAKTWGGNWQGQLGNGTQVAKSGPVSISAVDTNPVDPVQNPDISAGDSHTLAVGTDGAVYGWGSNEFGQVDGSALPQSKAVKISIAKASRVAAGDAHSLALLDTTGAVLAWGYNGSGQLGDGTLVQRMTPVPTQDASGDLSAVVAIAAGRAHSLALKSDANVLSWGQNTAGQLGINSVIAANKATAVTTLAGLPISAIACGHDHSLALRHDGGVYAWGVNESGQLGDGKTVSLKVPTQILGLSNIIALAAGTRHSLALRNDGTVWAWGANNAGQLGDASNVARSAPVQVSGLTGVIAIAANGEYSLALVDDGSGTKGTVWAWGNNAIGQLGDGTTTNSSKAKQVVTLAGGTLTAGTLLDIKAISAGTSHSVAIRNDGQAYAWGGNWYGQLGDGTSTNSTHPQDVSGTGVDVNLNLGAFTPLNNVPLSALVTSNAVYLGSFSGTLPVSVSGGTYSINGQPYTSLSQRVSAGSTVVLRQTSSSQPRTKTTATLVVGPKSARFDVTTRGNTSMAPILMLLLD